MAGDEAAAGSQSRRRMDPNMYFSLPPLWRPPGLIDDALDRPVSLPNSTGPAPVAPRIDEQMEFLAPMAVYSPWNALSTPEEQSMLDSFDYTWLEGHNTDGEEDTSVGGTNSSSSSSRLAPGLEAYEDLTPLVERFVRPGRVTGGVEMVSTTSLLSRSSIQGAVDIEARTPELRFQRLIRISQQHSIVRTRSMNRSQRASSPETDRLSWAIQCSHESLEISRRQKLDGDNKVGGKGAVNKDECCGCNSSFECNICLDPAKEPVVTPCGHLFCWPCLYKWLHAHSVHSECPVCKGEVLEVNVTPIYGRGDDQRDASGLGMPPRPCANRTQSLRQQLQIADARGIATVVRQLIENHGVVRGQPNPVEASVVPASRSRARVQRQQRQDSISAIMLNVGNVAPENSNQVPLPLSDADNTTPMVPAAPEQSSSMEQISASSTAAVIVGDSSRRPRPSGSPTTRRTRRRQP